MAVFRLENGVSEQAFKEQLQSSGKLLIVCTETAVRDGSRLHGLWQFYVHNEANNRWTPLHMFRLVKGKAQPRVFKTIDGVFGYMLELGLTVAPVPMKKGDGCEVEASGTPTYHPDVSLD
ncbi:hypothetical protein [Ensifer sp. SL37]|uniref:hypothetical protein n=1 Tax=Ensifer sp. SL37 TaxID=2995137 RepID=UPI0022735954|nr:hypothetical protein [Ensifer sp. SL37]MCY1740998.1 hypothetical protein [Ensifer sp. SL37]